MTSQCWCGQSEEGKTGIVRCGRCFLVRTSPYPKEQKKESGYLGQSDLNYRQQNLKTWQKIDNDIINIIKEYKTKGKLLDVGANLGLLVAQALESGYDAKGLDIDQGSIEAGKKMFNLNERLFFSSLSESGYKNEFDILVYNHVLEHIKDINAELTLAHAALKEKGLLFIAVPNYNSLWRRLLRSKWRGLMLDQHFWHYEPKTLKYILVTNHFTVIKIIKNRNILYNYNFSPVGLAKLFISSIAKIFQQGDNLIVIAEKR